MFDAADLKGLLSKMLPEYTPFTPRDPEAPHPALCTVVTPELGVLPAVAVGS
jgi:hypothetical protein